MTAYVKAVDIDMVTLGMVLAQNPQANARIEALLQVPRVNFTFRVVVGDIIELDEHGGIRLATLTNTEVAQARALAAANQRAAQPSMYDEYDGDDES